MMSQVVLLVISILSAILLYWIYDGYGRVLQAAVRLRPPGSKGVDDSEEDLPRVVVMLTVHDEEEVIEDRLRNLAETAYPTDRLRILVVSDNSTDQTNEIVAGFAGEKPAIEIELFAPAVSTGKSDAQNQAMETIDEEVVVFTDAGTWFHRECVRNLVRRLADPAVGMVDPELEFNQDRSAVSEGQGWYWRYERKLRRLESELGILAVGSGACMAVRRSLLDPIHSGVGEDCQVPLMVVGKGSLVVQEPEARAVDEMPSRSGSELRTRARMTARNLVGTLQRPRLLNPLLHPGVAFGLWSHKLLRWLSPIWLLCLLGATSGLGLSGGAFAGAGLAPVIFVVLAGIGFLGDLAGMRFPLAGHAWSFSLANLGFAWGILKACSGRTITRYSSS